MASNDKSDESVEMESGSSTDIDSNEMETARTSDSGSNECVTETTKSDSERGLQIFSLGSNNYRDSKGFLYIKNTCHKERLNLRCKYLATLGCRAVVNVQRNTLAEARMTTEHSHPRFSVKEDRLIFDKKLGKNIRETPFASPLDLYLKTKTDLLGKIDPENIKRFKKKKGFISRKQRKYFPLIPSTIEEFEQLILDEKYRNYFSKDNRNLRYYRGIWSSVKGERMVAFISQTILNKINTMDNVEFFTDSTFKACKVMANLHFRQLYVISVIYEGQCYPFAFILMEKKTFTSYDAVFTYLKLLMPSVEVVKVTCDYEAATRKALKKQYPNARIFGGFFHYVQGIVKSEKRFGLRSEGNLAVMKQVCALALLPNDFVLKGFQSIVDSLKIKSESWSRFQKYWMTQWAPANISVYGLAQSTNNFSETNSESFNLLLSRDTLNIWNLINDLKSLEMNKSDLIKRAAKGKMIETKSNKNMIRFNEKIAEATEFFDKEKAIQMFLKRVTFQESFELFVKDQVDLMEDYNDYDEEVIPNHCNIESEKSSASSC